MKAKQITEAGHYWYFRPGEAGQCIVEVEFGAGVVFWHMGDDSPYQADELPGQFIGPIVYQKPGMSAAEINALPPKAREYIMWLETDADPAGTLRLNYILNQENLALRKLLEEAEGKFHRSVKSGMNRKRQALLMNTFRAALGMERRDA